MSYIKLDRSIQSWEWYTNGNTLQVFIDLLLNANFEDRKWQGKTIYRGQLTATNSLIAERTGLTVAQVRRAMNHLVESGSITTRPERRYSVITIVNYNTYQNESQATPFTPKPQPKPKQAEYHYPTADEINEYAESLGKTIDAYKFINYYEGKHWLFHDGTPLNWKAAIKSWTREQQASEPVDEEEDDGLESWHPEEEVGETNAVFI